MVYLRNRIRQTDESDHSEFNYMSPIRPVITTITRKSVNMVAELDNDTAPSRILDASGQRLEDYSKVAKAAMAIAVALDTKARAAQGTVVQLKKRTRPISTVQDRGQDSSRFPLSDYIQATERIRNRHRGGPNTRTTRRRVAWTGSGTLHSVWLCMSKSNTFDRTRIS